MRCWCAAHAICPETLDVLAEPGTHDQWLPVLKGAKFRLELGYFVVRNPSQVRGAASAAHGRQTHMHAQQRGA